MFPLTEQTHLGTMELSASGGCGFLIGSLLSLRPPSALLSRADSPELNPGCGSGCSAPPSPRREPLPRLECPLLPGPMQPRSVCSSFLIRDILADRRSCSDPGQPEIRAEPFRCGPDESLSCATRDGEKRGKIKS